MDLSWASPLGIAAFFAGSGIFFYGFFSGLAAWKAAHRDSSRGAKP
jgi:hypothetical protein